MEILIKISEEYGRSSREIFIDGKLQYMDLCPTPGKKENELKTPTLSKFIEWATGDRNNP